MTGPEPDDIDERFARLVATEFGDAAWGGSGSSVNPLDEQGRRPDGSALPPLAPRPAARRFPAASTDEEPDVAAWAEDYRDAPAPPVGAASPLTMVGILALSAGLLMLVGLAFGVRLPAVMVTVAGVLAVGGLAVLLRAALRRPARDQAPPPQV